MQSLNSPFFTIPSAQSSQKYSVSIGGLLILNRKRTHLAIESVFFAGMQNLLVFYFMLGKSAAFSLISKHSNA